MTIAAAVSEDSLFILGRLFRDFAFPIPEIPDISDGHPDLPLPHGSALPLLHGQGALRLMALLQSVPSPRMETGIFLESVG